MRCPITLRGFEILTDNAILANRPDLMLINKKKSSCHLEEFAVSAVLGRKIKANRKSDKYLDLARGLKKAVEHEADSDAYCS